MQLTPKEQTLLESGRQLLPSSYKYTIALYRHVRNSLTKVQPSTAVWRFYMDQARQLRDYACVLHKLERTNDDVLCYSFRTEHLSYAKYMHGELRHAAVQYGYELCTGGEGYIQSKLEIVLVPDAECNPAGLRDWIEDYMPAQIILGGRWPVEIHGMLHTTLDVDEVTTPVTDVDSAGDFIPVKP